MMEGYASDGQGWLKEKLVAKGERKGRYEGDGGEDIAANGNGIEPVVSWTWGNLMEDPMKQVMKSRTQQHCSAEDWYQ